MPWEGDPLSLGPSQVGEGIPRGGKPLPSQTRVLLVETPCFLWDKSGTGLSTESQPPWR